VTAKGLIHRTQQELVDLLSHQQAPLALARRCSSLAGSTPLFSALLNYRPGLSSATQNWNSLDGISVISGQGHTSYPIDLSGDDLGDHFALMVQTDCRVEPQRVLEYVSTALLSLLQALEQAPHTPALSLAVLPESERQAVIERFNATAREYPQKVIHQLIEEQV